MGIMDDIMPMWMKKWRELIILLHLNDLLIMSHQYSLQDCSLCGDEQPTLLGAIGILVLIFVVEKFMD